MSQVRSPIARFLFIIASLFFLASSIGCGAGKSGSFIAFRRNNQIWTAWADGTGQRRLTEGFDASPSVSPDGSTIIFEHSRGNPYKSDSTEPIRPRFSIGIHIIPTVGGESRLLTPSAWLNGSGWKPLLPLHEHSKWVKRNCVQPSFSPDGKSISFLIIDEEYIEPPVGVKHSRIVQGIAIMGVAEADEPRVILTRDMGETLEDNIIADPRFSSDGKEIYFVYMPTNWGSEIDRVSVDGGDLIPITPKIPPDLQWNEGRETINVPQRTQYKAFGVSPTQRQIALVANITNKWSRDRMILMQLDTQHISELYVSRRESDPKYPKIAYEPLSYSASGSSIAFADEEHYPHIKRKVPSCIYIVTIDGANPKKVISDGDQPCFGSTPT